MRSEHHDIQNWSQHANSREQFWIRCAKALHFKQVAELGVFRGDFASTILAACPDIEGYTMIDPWRHLDDWNKPANKDGDQFEQFYKETLTKTDFAKEKRRILRGTTIEVAAQIDNESLDFAYIDGDHTLKGITIDMVNMFPKIKSGGYIGGDDFSPSIWQHMTKYEPTLVFPFAIYFAEAMNARIYSLPFAQFLIEKDPEGGFEHIDLAGQYQNTDLKSQLTTQKIITSKLKDISRSLRSRG